MADPALPERTRPAPPGVDIHSFPAPAAGRGPRRLRRLADRVEDGEAASYAGERGAAEALRSLDPGRDRIVSYGQADRLQGRGPAPGRVAASGGPCPRRGWSWLAGTYRDGLERMLSALAAGDMEELRAVAAAAGRELRAGCPESCATCASSSTGRGPSTRRPRPPPPPGCTSRAGPSTPTGPACRPRARPRSCRAPSPRPSGWWPPRPRPAARRRSRPPTPAWPRSRPALASALEEELRLLRPSRWARRRRRDRRQAGQVADLTTPLASVPVALAERAAARFGWENVARERRRPRPPRRPARPNG